MYVCTYAEIFTPEIRHLYSLPQNPPFYHNSYPCILTPVTPIPPITTTTTPTIISQKKKKNKCTYPSQNPTSQIWSASRLPCISNYWRTSCTGHL